MPPAFSSSGGSCLGFLTYLLLTDQVLIREDEINCMDSVVINVAPLSSDNEDVFGRPRHSEEAVRVAATLRQVDPCHEEKRVGPCKAAIPRLVASHSRKYTNTNTNTQIQEWERARLPYPSWLVASQSKELSRVSNLNPTLLPPGSSLTVKAAAVPVSTTAAVVATATILPPSRIVRPSVSAQEGKTYLHLFPSLPISNMFLG